MKRLGALLLVFFSVCVVIALNSSWGQEKNLDVNKEVTAKIRAFDRSSLRALTSTRQG